MVVAGFISLLLITVERARILTWWFSSCCWIYTCTLTFCLFPSLSLATGCSGKSVLAAVACCSMYNYMLTFYLCIPPPASPWYNRNGWLGVKLQVTYLLIPPADHCLLLVADRCWVNLFTLTWWPVILLLMHQSVTPTWSPVFLLPIVAEWNTL